MSDLSSPVEHFKKLAKTLLKQVQSQDSSACQRARTVYNDLSAMSDAEVAASFGLMRAQHAVAVEYGFAKWADLLQRSPVDQHIAITMVRLPLLNDFGIGMYSQDRKLPEAERRARFEENRQQLRNSAERVAATVEWLRQNVEPIKTINRKHTSYGIKHIAEKDIGYITNGVFIAAAVIAGYPYEIVPGSPNVPFGMSEKSLKETEMLHHNPKPLLERIGRRATELLAARGICAYAPSRLKSELVWSEGGEMRTLMIVAQETRPLLVRLALDHSTLFASQRVARTLGEHNAKGHTSIRPSRPKAEITILPTEVEDALRWALPHDSRLGPPATPPPFETAPVSRPSDVDTWEYVWSKCAVEAYRREKARLSQFGAAG